jgi:hypothetical protein
MREMILSTEDLENDIDTVKIVLIHALVKDNLLDAEKADMWADSHGVVLKEERWFKRILGKVNPNVDKNPPLQFVVVKTVYDPPTAEELDKTV